MISIRCVQLQDAIV